MISTNLDLRIKLEREPDGAWVKATDIGLIVARGGWTHAVAQKKPTNIPRSEKKTYPHKVLHRYTRLGQQA